MRVPLFLVAAMVIAATLPRAAPADDLTSLNKQAQTYFEKGRYDSALAVAIRALDLAESSGDPEDPGLAVSLNGLAQVYRVQGQYLRAEPLYERALEIRSSTLGPSDPGVAEILNNLAELYIAQGEYAEAESLCTRALEIREQALGPEHPDVAQSMNNLAEIYDYRGQYAEARPLYERALEIRQKTLGPDHPDVAESLNNLAILHDNHAEYATAESLYHQALEIREKALGPEHPDVAESLNNLAVFYEMQGQYARAEPYYQRSLEIWEKALGPDHPDVAASLNNLAIFYDIQGRYDEAGPLYQRSLAIREKALGPDHPDVAASLNNLALLCKTQGRYTDAEPLYQRSLAIKEKTLGPDHPDVATSLNNLALLYRTQGLYSLAEPLYQRALAIREKAYGPDHPRVAQSLSNLAVLYSIEERYAEAEPLYRRSLEIREKAYGPDHPRLAFSLNSLAGILDAQGRFDEAEPLYKRALKLREDALGAEHPRVAQSLIGLADHYSKRGMYDDADGLFARAMAIQEKAFGSDHPEIATNLEHMSQNYSRAGRADAAMRAAHRAFEIRSANFRDASTLMSESRALTYSRFMHLAADRFLSAFFDCETRTGDALVWAADVVLSTKGQASEAVFVRAAEMNMLAQVGALADSLRETRTRLSGLYVAGPGADDPLAHREALDRASADKDRLETELARTNATYRNLEDALYVDSGKIAGALKVIPRPMTLVEYMRYNYQKDADDDGDPHYLVLVMDSTGPRAIVDLGEAARIDRSIGEYRAHMLELAASGRWPDQHDRAGYVKIAAAIYEEIWGPVENLVRDASSIDVAPDAGINLIPFAALVSPDGTYFIDHYRLHCLSSGRDLVRLKEPGSSGTGLLAMGDPDYDARPVAGRTSAAAGEDQTCPPQGPPGLRNLHLTPLPGTRTEVEMISARWREITSEPAAVYLGTDATETRLREESPGKRVIHLATHGYFLEAAPEGEPPEPTDLEAAMSFAEQNPLLRTGLCLAGANQRGSGAGSAGAADGILTAEEVTAMNLTGTQLVVLSACETGLGKVKSGEGVYGLRRAFQMAGARTVISALWPVSDVATAEMMGKLYGRRGESLADAMRRIQLEQLAALRAAGKSDHPFTWAAFIGIGDWR